jgi:hypothetical protein
MIGATMMPGQQNNKEEPQNNGVNYGDMAVAFFALAPELLLHDWRSFGIRSVAPRAAGTVVAMYLFAMCYTFDNQTPLLALTAIVALLSICAHISAARRERGGPLCHSFYNGRPWAMAILPMSEGRMKRTEPLLLILSGWGIHHLNCPLGSFIVTSGACYGFRVLLETLGMRRRTRDLNDAMAEQAVAVQSMQRNRRRKAIVR